MIAEATQGMSVLLPAGWKAPVGYANGIAAKPGRLVFVAGQVGWDAGQVFRSAELAPQFEQALENVLAVLAEAAGFRSAAQLSRLFRQHYGMTPSQFSASADPGGVRRIAERA